MFAHSEGEFICVLSFRMISEQKQKLNDLQISNNQMKTEMKQMKAKIQKMKNEGEQFNNSRLDYLDSTMRNIQNRLISLETSTSVENIENELMKINEKINRRVQDEDEEL